MLTKNGMVSQLLRDTPLPRMFPARQTFDSNAMPPQLIRDVIWRELSDVCFLEQIMQGGRIGIAVGSRGIRNVDVITKAIVDFVREHDAFPFVFPAMGSHGGATAEGQRAVLAAYGVTEEALGCPVLSSMDVVEIGVSTGGRRVYMDRNAWESDGVIVTGRIKPHTSFRGRVESGICKMMTVGMGKQRGASAVHAEGMGHMAEAIVDMAETVIRSGKVLFAVPCIENGYDQIEHIEAILPGDILNREPVLLRRAFKNMPRLIVGSGDVLVVKEIGKDFGGTGADPNITGRFPTEFATGGVDVERVAFLRLSEASHGNAMGCGLADVITKKLFDAIDFDAMYANCTTSRVLASARIPCVMPTEKEALQFCVRTCTGKVIGNPRIICIENTLQISSIMLSEAYYDDVISGRYPGVEALDTPSELEWDAMGNILTTSVV